jgi:hypothetical protein
VHWTKWSWLVLAGAMIVALVAAILFAPEIESLRRLVAR